MHYLSSPVRRVFRRVISLLSVPFLFVFRFGQQRCQRETQVQHTSETPRGTSVRVCLAEHEVSVQGQEMPSK